MTLQGKTLFVTGASRGIGLAIAVRAARDGAKVAIAAKSAQPQPDMPGTIHSTAEEVQRAGGQGLALQLDLRDAKAIGKAVEQAAVHFGGIDCLIHNAAHVSLSSTESLEIEQLDQMLDVNVRSAFVLAQACLPYLKRGSNPHILLVAPPLSVQKRWFAPHLAYTVSKYALSMCVLGMSEEFRKFGIAVNALWPYTVIDTMALRQAHDINPDNCRKPDIMADAAHAILTMPRRQTGRFLLDEQVLRDAGVTDFRPYAVTPGQALMSDLFID